MNSLNLTKPISRAQKAIAQKCGWKNMNDVPVRKNVLPDGFVGTAKPVSKPLTIGTHLNRNNTEILEIIMDNDKLFNSPFVKINMNELLSMSNSHAGKRLMKVLLTPENINKIDTQRRLIKNNPKAYIKDKDIVKYISTPAGLNSVFADVNILKAAAVFDSKTLDKLFRMDITEGSGKKLLDTLGKIEQVKLSKIKELAQSENPELALDYLKLEAKV